MALDIPTQLIAAGTLLMPLTNTPGFECHTQKITTNSNLLPKALQMCLPLSLDAVLGQLMAFLFVGYINHPRRMAKTLCVAQANSSAGERRSLD
jgi:hypothetical protein